MSNKETIKIRGHNKSCKYTDFRLIFQRPGCALETSRGSLLGASWPLGGVLEAAWTRLESNGDTGTPATVKRDIAKHEQRAETGW